MIDEINSNKQTFGEEEERERKRIKGGKYYSFFKSIISADLEEIEKQFDQETDILLAKRYGRSSLQIAIGCEEPNLEVISLLLKKNANPNIFSSFDGNWFIQNSISLLIVQKKVSMDFIMLC